MWKEQIKLLGGNYRVVALDLPGQGKTGAGSGQFTIEFMVDDLVGLMDRLKVSRAVLCGLSMGGYVALRTVERHSDRVSGLILCDTKSEADTNDGKLGRSAAIKQINELGVRVFAANFLKNAFSQTSLTDSKMVNAATRIILRNKRLGLCGMLLALASRTDTTLSLTKIRVPTLILVGEHDKITPPTVSEQLHSSIPNSELCLIPNAGHISNLERPIDFNSSLLNFLEKKFG
jgi:pimeloyl-ACP methyl ester carboxylesterase